MKRKLTQQLQAITKHRHSKQKCSTKSLLKFKINSPECNSVSNLKPQKQKHYFPFVDKKNQILAHKHKLKTILEYNKKGYKKQRNTHNITLKNNLNNSMKNFSFMEVINLTKKNKEIKRSNCGKSYYKDQIKQAVKMYIQGKQPPFPALNHIFLASEISKKYDGTQIPEQPHTRIDFSLSNDKITLLFDMDQTLIHCEQYVPNGNGKKIMFNLEDCEIPLQIFIRPHVKETIERLSQIYQIGIFTASQEKYANTVLNYIDPHKKLFKFRLFRQHCLSFNGLSVKDLRILNKDLSKVILIDNSPHTYIFQPNNAIPIISFYDDEKDMQLLYLQQFLSQMHEVQDVREILKDYFHIKKYPTYDNIFQLVKQIY